MTQFTDFFLSNSFIQLVFFLICGFIKIPKIELNIWNLIGKALNKKTEEKIDALQTTLQEHIQTDARFKATQARNHILRFNDELLNGISHSPEYYDEILEDINFYESYCAQNPQYPNNKAFLSIENIKTHFLKEKENSK